jgi:hypothetical protein
MVERVFGPALAHDPEGMKQLQELVERNPHAHWSTLGDLIKECVISSYKRNSGHPALARLEDIDRWYNSRVVVLKEREALANEALRKLLRDPEARFVNITQSAAVTSYYCTLHSYDNVTGLYTMTTYTGCMLLIEEQRHEIKDTHLAFLADCWDEICKIRDTKFLF